MNNSFRKILVINYILSEVLDIKDLMSILNIIQ